MPRQPRIEYEGAIYPSCAKTTTAPDGTTQVQNYVDGLPAESLAYAAGSQIPLRDTLFGYDDLARQTAQTERRHLTANGADTWSDFTTTTSYFDGGQVQSVLTPYDTANATGGTVYTRDTLGRETSARLPDGSTRTTSYTDAQGTIRVAGSQTYPQETKLDPFGQTITLTTWQDYAGQSGAAVIQWTYDAASGLLARKQYADGKGTDYTYDAAGQLTTRTWARRIITSYTYTGAGQLESVTYSDGLTPNVWNSYDRNGNRLASNDSVFGYDQGTLLPVSETLPIGGTNITRTLVRSRDALLRDTGFTLWSGSTAEVASAWTYDAAGRPETVTGTSLGASAAQSFTYGWQDGRPDLLARVDGPAHTVVNTWEPLRGVLAAKSNRRTDSAGGAVISGYTYAVNSLGQRVSVTQSGSAFYNGSAFNLYGYDAMGQLTTANRYTGGTLAEPQNPVTGEQFGFAFDTIGNRTAATLDTTGTTAYTPNALNQYSAIQSGTAAAVEPAYDADGNQLADATLNCQWDGENRLVSVTKTDGTQVTCAYDAQSRRVRKTVTSGSAVISNTAYLYDGWNLIAEYSLTSDGNNGTTATLQAANTWGIDLSGSRQGAGGVGGLLTRTTGGATYAYSFDGNGNVSELLDLAGNTAAHYEYGPFGEPLRVSGAMAGQNPFRFSTKYTDDETGLLYYGYRFYNPSTGRWVSRDPIGENGGINLYEFCANRPTIRIDLLGMKANGVDDFVVHYYYGNGKDFNLIDRGYEGTLEAATKSLVERALFDKLMAEALSKVIEWQNKASSCCNETYTKQITRESKKLWGVLHPNLTGSIFSVGNTTLVYNAGGAFTVKSQMKGTSCERSFKFDGTRYQDIDDKFEEPLCIPFLEDPRGTVYKIVGHWEKPVNIEGKVN